MLDMAEANLGSALSKLNMSRINLLIMVAGVVAALIGAALIAYSTGDFGAREGDPPGYGLDPTKTTPQPTQP